MPAARSGSRRSSIPIPTGAWTSSPAVAAASKGERNNRLNAAAFNMGTLVGAGVLEEEIAQGWLLVAALNAGLPEAEAKRTIASGLRSGTAQPRDVRRAG